MMKKAFLLVGIFFLTSSVTAQNDSLLHLFRVLHLADKKINLQDNINKYADIVVKTDPTHYHLKKGSYGIADSIDIEVNAANQITAFRFFYNYEPEFSNDTAYIHELHKYQKIINSPGREYVFTSKQISIKATKWEERQTIYELLEVMINGKKRTCSVIFDKPSYFNTIKCAEIKNKDNSLELLRKIGVY